MAKKPGSGTYNPIDELDQLRFALDNVPSYVYIKDRESKYIYANKLTLDLFGCSAQELPGRDDSYFFPPDTVKRLREIDLRVLAGESTQEEVIVNEPGHEQRIYHEVKTPIYDKSDGNLVIGLLGISTDITAQKKLENEIRKLAFTDPLTKLPNRRLLFDRIEQAISRNKRQKNYSAVLFVDLNNFKTINDTSGHEAGDKILIQVADRLVDNVRDSDTVARIGGDEFIVLLQEAGPEKSQATSYTIDVSRRIENQIRKEYVVNETRHRISASIGIYLFSGETKTASEIITNADAEMYKKKRETERQHQS